MITNSTLDVIRGRRSIRAYTQETLTNDQVEALVEAALWSPSAVNSQPWHLITITDRDLILELEADLVAEMKRTGNDALRARLASRNDKALYDTPCFFAITTRDSRNYESIDAGIMAQSICLAAESMGLGSVMIGSMRTLFEAERGGYWRERLGFPEGFDYTVGVCVGHPNMQGNAREIDRNKVSYIRP